ncbi:PH domain-containing protein [Actinomyces oris]|uniref:PH domain-containing protein n=1 Tax=Actinomyces oris TaxID=544580 RepID=UPI0009D66BFF|nr:PH domain-containing protein [Actinomyces oris]
MRDSAVFTSKRLIVRDVQGLTGRKAEIYSLPYSAINMWSTENAGTFGMNSEVELWTRAGHIKIKFGVQVDVRKIDRLISACVSHVSLSIDTRKMAGVDSPGGRRLVLWLKTGSACGSRAR